MNILSISSTNNFTNYRAQNKEQVISNRFGLKISSPITQDTVSFRALTIKEQPKGAKIITKTVAKQIEEIAAKRQKAINKYIDKLFGHMCVTEYSPSNLIYAIKKRSKLADSIREKATTRAAKEAGWNTKDGILKNATDLNGVKIVLRDGSRKSTSIILETLKDDVEKGNLIIHEIENKRPLATLGKKGFEAEKYDYASSDYLYNYVNQINKLQNIKVNYNHGEPDFTEINYPAIHLLAELPGTGHVFEIQIMGKDVALYKDLDDILFKILNNKNVDKKYKPIVDRIQPLNELGNADLKSRFNQYRGNVFLFQREKAPHIGQVHNEYFLPPKDEFEGYDVAGELDMNELYRLMLECDKKVAKK